MMFLGKIIDPVLYVPQTNMSLPIEIWNLIFSYDPHRHAIREAHADYMIRLYRHFVVDEIHPRPCHVNKFSSDAFRIRYGREEEIVRWELTDSGQIRFEIDDRRRFMHYSCSIGRLCSLRPCV